MCRVFESVRSKADLQILYSCFVFFFSSPIQLFQVAHSKICLKAFIHAEHRSKWCREMRGLPKRDGFWQLFECFGVYVYCKVGAKKELSWNQILMSWQVWSCSVDSWILWQQSNPIWFWISTNLISNVRTNLQTLASTLDVLDDSLHERKWRKRFKLCRQHLILQPLSVLPAQMSEAAWWDHSEKKREVLMHINAGQKTHLHPPTSAFSKERVKFPPFFSPALKLKDQSKRDEKETV